MMTRTVPPWFDKARTIAARVESPVGKPLAAAKKGTTCDLYLYDAIGRDPFSGLGIDPQDVIAMVADAKGSDELVVHVNSPGGYVFDGIAIHNAIRSFAGKKTVCVEGICASIATVIALAGDKVITKPGAMWMVHDPAGGLMSFGTADQIEEDARKTCAALRKVRENLVDLYVSATGAKASEVSAWMTAETWMTAAEALARGFTDEIDSECECDCPECEGGDCEECSCGGCAACAEGKSCNEGDCDQGGTPRRMSADLEAMKFAAMVRERKLKSYRKTASPPPAPASPGKVK